MTPAQSFSDLYFSAIPIDFKGGRDELKELRTKEFPHSPGTLLRAMDDYDRRIIVVVGKDGQNVVVNDRYPDIVTTMFLFYAPHDIAVQLPPVLKDEHVVKLIELTISP